MKASELANKIKEYLDNGTIDNDTEIEFLREGDTWNDGSYIGNTLVVKDGDDNIRMFVTDYDKVIL